MMMRLFSLTLVLGAGFLTSVRGGQLEDYVSQQDEAFAYDVKKEATDLGVRILSVRLTSQEWRGHLWKHWLTVFIPPTVDDHEKAVLLIEGGSNRDGLPDAGSRAGRMMALTAANLKAPVALLLQVPSQPLYDDLYEDDLIAHTFDQFLRGGDDDWPLLLPMVKSATAAMDALQELAAEKKLKTASGTPFLLKEFIVSGASKRGWTTWLTAAVDKRVCALAPSVIDVLNMSEQMKLQRRSYGRFSEKITPYTSRNIMNRMIDSPRGELLRRIVDPFEYLDRLRQPKLMLLGTNDPYWTADSAQLYYPKLQGPKGLYYLPNAGHGLGLGVLPTLNGFLVAALHEKPFPQLRTENGDGRMAIHWEGDGKAVLWKADSATRDFREAEWTSLPLEGEGSVTLQPDLPENGWRASYVTVAFPGFRPADPDFKLSTPIRVVPETFPHDDRG